MKADATLPDVVNDLITEALDAAGDVAAPWLRDRLQVVVDLVRDDWQATQRAFADLDTTVLEQAAEHVVATAHGPDAAAFGRAVAELQDALVDHRATIVHADQEAPR